MAKKTKETGMWMDVAAVAILLGVSRDTVYRYVNEGHIPGFKLGGRYRFRRDEMEQWLKKQSRAGLLAAGADAPSAQRVRR